MDRLIRINRNLIVAISVASPLILPIGMGHLEASFLLEKGYSKEFIEQLYREELPKGSPFIGPIREFITRPGRKIAYVTTESYKFPWKGYDRKVFR